MGNHHKDILLVEDNPDDEALTRLAFEKNKITNPLIVAHDGVEALDFLFGRGEYADRNLDQQPELILLDLKLPRVDGLEVLEAIRSNPLTKLIPVIVLTSSSEDKDLARAYELGANAYVRKPVDFIEFLEAVCLLRRFWLGVNEHPLQSSVERNKAQ